MAADFATKAKDAFIEDHYELAIDLYSQAIEMDSTKAELFADRAQANIKLKIFIEAVSDADKAIELDPCMAKAYIRKGMACIRLGEYHAAKEALKQGSSLAPEDSRFANMIRECDEHISEVIREKLSAESSKVTPSASLGEPGGDVDTSMAMQTVNELSTPTVPPAKPKYRHEYYQKSEEIVVTIFAKGVPAKSVRIDFGEQVLSTTIDIPGDEPYSLHCRLFGKIIPVKCRYEVLSTKIEIFLAKAESIHWPSLEFSRMNAPPQKISLSTGTQRPTYPSSKSRGVDWDRLEAEVKKEEKEEKLEGDSALNKLFQDIYRSADEDTRRAMSKSFLESNGTVLSTDWKEVGSKKVEKSLPDGMELKKWEY